MGRQGIGGDVIRVGAATAIPVVLDTFGIDSATVFSEAGVALEMFADADNTLPVTALGSVLNLCAHRSGRPDFGLQVGVHGSLTSLGLIGYLAQQSPDVGTALRSLVQHLQLHDRGAVATLTSNLRMAAVGYHLNQAGVPGADHIVDGALAITLNILRGLCGPAFQPAAVSFAHRQPQNLAPYRQFFSAPLQFNSEANTIAFAPHWLDRALPRADPALRNLLQDRVRELEAREPGGTADQIRRVLRTMLRTGSGSEGKLADLFTVHRRTINRRLQAEQTTFQRLSDEVRFELARQMLDNPDMPLIQVAAMLDYADASAFTRAFRRWSGTTPGRWRQQRRVAAVVAAALAEDSTARAAD